MKKLILSAALAVLLVVGAAPLARADYGGSRFPDVRNVTGICVALWELDHRYSVTGTKRAVQKLNERMDGLVKLYLRDTCNHWKYKIVVKDGWYGRNGWAGLASYHNLVWQDVPGQARHWTASNGYTWTHTRSVVKLNHSTLRGDGYGQRYYSHVAGHEILHALGLEHQYYRCKSIMAQGDGCWPYEYTYAQWADHEGTWAHPGVHKVYWNG